MRILVLHTKPIRELFSFQYISMISASCHMSLVAKLCFTSAHHTIFCLTWIYTQVVPDS